ncbi:alpha,alpha-trehalose-phosphate synthase (UDP-forming) [Nevskia sp.]|uniref:alpha,alpha-trehalose-phosphate synthase (UDP-forming) n=1 Tax=Nevskia sp. TaxID=1929292 RepID=UPI0025E6035C|nr:alpha,alpha-trehalose-phosphate synthase (UDP-forming) [Nevskia sp.]
MTDIVDTPTEPENEAPERGLDAGTAEPTETAGEDIVTPLLAAGLLPEPRRTARKTALARKQRLVAVSNRVGPVRSASRAGGLAVALVDTLRETGGLWFGWSGKIADEGAVRTERSSGITTATLDLSQDEFDEYYNGFANRCLWPLFHYRMDLTAYDRRFYDGYLRVNRRFADALVPLLKSDDLLWVHDYHLLPFGQVLRELGVQQLIGFFLHIPFPSREVLATLPHHHSLVRALFSYDLVGFQTEADSGRFVDYVLNEVEGSSLVGDVLHAFGRNVRVMDFPIGIDTGEYASFTNTEDGRRQTERVRAALRGRAQIIGVDRLDYTKGLPDRFIAFEHFLDNYPEAHGRVELLQIAPTSRGEVPEYVNIREQLEQAAGRINSRHAEVDWTPIRYMNRTVSRRALAGLFRASAIGLVTPLRDGMNLVAKEYVAAQDPQDPGVLILSRFAGAAQQMSAALIVNPYDPVSVAENINRALQMPLAERRARHQTLLQGLYDEDLAHWRQRFVTALSEAAATR